MQLALNFLIFSPFVSPLEKLLKRPQEYENQKVIEYSVFLMDKMGSGSPPPLLRNTGISDSYLADNFYILSGS